MKPHALETEIRRILIGLDASAGSLAALEGAATFASRLGAELLGLFVEDENLLRLAGLPFAEELEFVSARKRPLKAEDMEQRLRAQALRAEQALSLAAERHRIRWQFRVVRGALASELVAAIQDVDLTALGRLGGPFVGSGIPARAALDAIVNAEHPILLLAPNGRIQEPIAVLYTGHPLAQQALAIGARLAEQDGGSLLVFVLADQRITEATLMRTARETVENVGLTAELRIMQNAHPQTIVNVARTYRIGTFVLHGNLGSRSSALAHELAEEEQCTVILVQ